MRRSRSGPPGIERAPQVCNDKPKLHHSHSVVDYHVGNELDEDLKLDEQRRSYPTTANTTLIAEDELDNHQLNPQAEAYIPNGWYLFGSSYPPTPPPSEASGRLAAAPVPFPLPLLSLLEPSTEEKNEEGQRWFKARPEGGETRQQQQQEEGWNARAPGGGPFARGGNGMGWPVRGKGVSRSRHQQQQQQSAKQSNEPLKSNEPRTTVMLRNVPYHEGQTGVYRLLEDQGFRGKFDFFYAPIDFNSGNNLGYAFINFRKPEEVEEFFTRMDGLRVKQEGWQKELRVCWARVQGLCQNIEHYRNSPVNEMPPPFRPMLFESDGSQIPFPRPDVPKQ